MTTFTALFSLTALLLPVLLLERTHRRARRGLPAGPMGRDRRDDRDLARTLADLDVIAASSRPERERGRGSGRGQSIRSAATTPRSTASLAARAADRTCGSGAASAI